MKQAKVAVIGAGIAGLTCAYRLGRLRQMKGWDLEVTLLEASGRPGGTIETEKKDGFLLEKGPDSFITEKPWATGLCKELGLEPQLIGTCQAHRRSFVVRRGRLVPLPEGFYLIAPLRPGPFLASPLFSPLGKLRMAAEFFIPPQKNGGDESIGGFIRRRFGQEALERVGQPMLGGIYTGDPDRLSLSATMPRFRTLEKEHGSLIRGLLSGKKKAEAASRGPRYGLFASLTEGLEALPETLLASLPRSALKLNSKVRELSFEPPEKKWTITLDGGEKRVFDAVCLSISAAAAARLLEKTSTELSEQLRRVDYESVATINFAYPKSAIAHPLDGFGFVTPAAEKSCVMACTFVTTKFEGRAPEGQALLRVFVGGAFGRGHYAKDDADLIASAQKDLENYLGAKGKPLFAALKRYPDSMAQYAVGHLEFLEGLEKSLAGFPGLYLTGSSYRGVGIPDCIRDADLQAAKIADHCFGN